MWPPWRGHYFHEPFNWVTAGKSYTVRQSKFVFELCAKQPFSEATVAR